MEQGKVEVIQSVSGIHTQARRVGLLCTVNQPLEFSFPFGFFGKVFGKLARVQLNKLTPRPRRRFDLLRVRGNKQADINARIVEFFARLGQRVFVGNNIEPALGGHLKAALGHQADNVWLEFQGDADDFRGVRHFEVEARLDRLPQAPDIAVLDVPAIFAQVRRDAMRAGGFTDERGRDGAGFSLLAAAIPRFAQRRDVVNVYTEFQHASQCVTRSRQINNEMLRPFLRVIVAIS